MFTFSLIVLVIVGLIILLALGGIGAVPKPDKKNIVPIAVAKLVRLKSACFAGES